MRRIVLACAIWCVTTVAGAHAISDWVIFGDSLSDSGNSYEYSHHQKPPKSMYYRGRYSNGPIWVDYLRDHFIQHKVKPLVLNYAFGGAGVLHSQAQAFTLKQEIDSYLLSHHTVPTVDTRFVIWVGANDYLLQPDAAPSIANNIVTAIHRNIMRLIRHGAQHIIIIGLPDLGRSPFARDLELQQPLSALSHRHNMLLKQCVMRLQARYPKVDWQYIDADHLFGQLMSRPKQYGFTHVTGRCIEPGKQRQPRHCLRYVFFDQFHPTTRVHKLFAQHVLQQLYP